MKKYPHSSRRLGSALIFGGLAMACLAVVTGLAISDRPAAAALVRPVLTGSVISSTHIKLSWKYDVYGVRRYTVRRSSVSGVERNAFSIIGTTPGSTKTFTDSVDPATKYYYFVQAQMSGGQPFLSNVVNLATPPLDTQDPLVALTEPSNGTTYYKPQTVILKATATDNVGVTKVNFFRDGGLASTVSTPPYQHSWNVGATDTGRHVWVARALDGAGHGKTSAPVALTVALDDAAPTVPTDVHAPVVDCTLVPLSWTASLDVGPAGLQEYRVYRDGVLVAHVPASSSAFTDTIASVTTYAYSVSAVDNAGNESGRSVPVSPTFPLRCLDPVPPTASIDAPPANTVFSTAQVVSIHAVASDNPGGTGVASVSFYDNGELRGQMNTPPFAFPWSIASADNGRHSWKVLVTDNAGNTAWSAPLAVTVYIPSDILQDITIVCPPGQKNFYGQCVNVLGLFGEPNLRETAQGAVAAGTLGYHSSGVVVDRSVSPNRLYVADTGNNRILGFRSTSSNVADIIIGQPDAVSSSCNGDNNRGIYGSPTASTLCLMQYPAVDNTAESWQFMNFDVDGQGNLFVTDRHNNRVLEYYQPFSADTTNGRGDTAADVVYGQADFTANKANRNGAVGASTLYLNKNAFAHIAVPSFGGVSVDATGNVWIADYGNARVLRFAPGSTTPNLVLGQSDFTSSAPNALSAPAQAIFDSVGKELYVLDSSRQTSGQRIVVFAVDPQTGDFSNGMPPVRVLEPTIPGVTVPSGATYWFSATGITLNHYRVGPYAAGILWANENHPGKRVLLLDAAGTIVTAIGSGGVTELGNTGCDHGAWLNWPGGSSGIDDSGNLYVADEGHVDVATYDLTTQRPFIDPANGRACPAKPTRWMLGPNGFAADRINSLSAGAIVAGNQLLAKDKQRILIWNNYLTKPLGAPADMVLGQDGFDAVTRNDVPVGGRWSTIDDHNRLWSGEGWGGHLTVFQLPIVASNQNPISKDVHLYWQDDPTSEVSYQTWSPAFDPVQKKLWLADGNRLLRISNYQDIGQPGAKLLVDMVFGQLDKTSNACNQGGADPAGNTFCPAQQIRFDHQGNLYVVENDYECHGNDRITVFLAADLAAASGMFPNLAAKLVFGATMTVPGQRVQNCSFSPISVAFNSRNQMVVGTDGLGGSTTVSRAFQQLLFFATPLTKQTADATIHLPMGSSGELHFDEQDNLMIKDHTWHRIWVINIDQDPTWLVPR